MAAGGSADRWAGEKLAQANQLAAEVRRLRGAAASERHLVTELSALESRGWRLLVDRRWPGTRAANIDLILVGPGGIFVIDAKHWSGPHVVGDRLFNVGIDQSDKVDQVLAAADAVTRSLTDLEVVPAAVTPMMVFTGRSVTACVRGVRLIGLAGVMKVLTARPGRLGVDAVRRIAEILHQDFVVHAGDSAAPTMSTSDGSLFSRYELMYEVQRRAMEGTIEEWMTFLHPDQGSLVRRDWNGPARISGPPGTGKTVVALHRAVHLARRTPGRILFTSYVKTLPNTAKVRLRLLDLACGNRVEFASLHGWAFDLLRRRRRPMAVDQRAVTRCFQRAWLHSYGRSVLSAVEPDPEYWRDEIDDVIKGRGIVDVDEYLQLARRGRGTILRATHRHAVWDLFQRYEQERREHHLFDFNDMIAAALAEVGREPVDPPYAAVIVDEAQDLNLIAMKLAYALIGDAPNGLLLVGDGRQNVYRHSYRLAEAGLSIRGDRAQVLRINYRNRMAVVAAAQQVGAGQAFDDPDGFAIGADDPVTVINEGGAVDDVVGSPGELKAAMIAAIRATGDPGACAVLCQRRAAVTHWITQLRRAGLGAIDLDDYDATPTTGVKVGTIHRAKGLEFKHVFLPGWHRYVADAGPAGTPAADRQLDLRRHAYVGITRARDTVWRGSVTRSSNPVG